MLSRSLLIKVFCSVVLFSLVVYTIWELTRPSSETSVVPSTLKASVKPLENTTKSDENNGIQWYTILLIVVSVVIVISGIGVIIHKKKVHKPVIENPNHLNLQDLNKGLKENEDEQNIVSTIDGMIGNLVDSFKDIETIDKVKTVVSLETYIVDTRKSHKGKQITAKLNILEGMIDKEKQKYPDIDKYIKKLQNDTIVFIEQIESALNKIGVPVELDGIPKEKHDAAFDEIAEHIKKIQTFIDKNKTNPPELVDKFNKMKQLFELKKGSFGKRKSARLPNDILDLV